MSQEENGGVASYKACEGIDDLWEEGVIDRSNPHIYNFELKYYKL